MGEDGARQVVVNSVGREIRTLEKIPPSEGRRVQLTIDMDLQRAAEEGFKAGGFNGAAVILDPNSGEVLAFTSVPAYDPNDFAAGIDRATWASLNTDKLKPLMNRAIQGTLFAGIDVQDRRGDGGARGRHHHAGFPRVVRRRRHVLRTLLPVLEERRTRQRRPARTPSSSRATSIFYTVGNMLGVDKIHKWATLLGLGEKTGIDLPNEVARARAVDRMEAGENRREVVRGRNHLRVDRAGAGVDHAGFPGGDDGDASPTAARATCRICSKPSTMASGWKPVPPPPPKIESADEAGNDRRRFTTGCSWSSTAPAPAAARALSAKTCRARPGRRR